MSVDGNISATFQGDDRRTVGLNTNANIPCNQQPVTTYTNGSGANQANVLYQAAFTLSGSTETVNFYTGSFSDSYGTAMVLTGVKAIYIQNTSSTNNLVVGNAGTDPWGGVLSTTGTITLLPGDWIVMATPSAAGWPVTSTSCELLFTGTSGQTFSVALLGIGA